LPFRVGPVTRVASVLFFASAVSWRASTFQLAVCLVPIPKLSDQSQHGRVFFPFASFGRFELVTSPFFFHADGLSFLAVEMVSDIAVAERLMTEYPFYLTARFLLGGSRRSRSDWRGCQTCLLVPFFTSGCMMEYCGFALAFVSIGVASRCLERRRTVCPTVGGFL